MTPVSDTKITDYGFSTFLLEMRHMFDKTLLELLVHRGVGFSDKTKILVTCRKDFSTACVNLSASEEGSHKVTIGYGINNSWEAGGSRGTIEGYARLYILHEFGHILSLHPMLKKKQTDLPGFFKLLADLGLSSSLWNLFQDAHDENEVRKTLGIHFNWLSYEKVPETPRTPESFLWCLIQNEGSYPKFTRKLSETGKKVSDRIKDYYYPALLAIEDLDQMIELMKEWTAEYSDPTETWSRGSSSDGKSQGNPGDLQQSVLPPSGSVPEVKVGSLGNTEDIETEYLTPEERSLSDELNDHYGSKGCQILGKKGGALEDEVYHPASYLRSVMAEGNSLAKILTKVLSRGTQDVTSKTGARLDMVAELVGSPEYFIDEQYVSRHLYVDTVFDLSGSMQGLHLHEGLKLIWALHLLAKKGKVHGHVIFTKINGYALSTAIAFKDLKPGHLARAVANGSAEGIFHAIGEHKSLLKNSEVLYVYTDANICDLVLSKEQRREIIKTPVVGCYVEVDSKSSGNPCINSFDAWITSASAKELAYQMVSNSQIIKRKRR